MHPQLPPPIKPRVLVRARNGHGYTTSDGRYLIRPRYASHSLGGRIARIDGWTVTDNRSPAAADRTRTHGTLDRVRELYCAPSGRVPWLVCDMDDGVLRTAPTRRAAVGWLTAWACAPVLRRHHHRGDTSYEYVLGRPGEDDGTSVFVIRADHAHLHGWNPVQQPLFPWPDDAFTEHPAPPDTRTAPRPRLEESPLKIGTDLVIRCFLGLSTAHLRAETRANLGSCEGVLAFETTYGWLMHASENLDAAAGAPPELPPLVDLARANGCEYILFDADAPETNALPTFDG